MDSLPISKRLYYGYLSRMYAWLHMMNRRAILGIHLSAYARWLPIIVLLVGWLRSWPTQIMIAIVAIVLWINYSLWRAKKDNYLRFVPDSAGIMNRTDLEPLAANQKTPVAVSGLFSVSGRETNLLNRPAQYWFVPLGEHIVMAEERPGKYLYQFFNPENLQMIQQGWLLHGPRPARSLAVGFLSRWGPEYTNFGQLYEDGKDSGPAPKKVTIYLVSDDESIHNMIWQTIVNEARKVRAQPYESP